jgi:NADH-quinone oxidoreductase subunit J
LLIFGAVGLFLAMPGGRVAVNRIGLLLLAAAGGTLISLIAQAAAGRVELGWFAGCALVGLFAAVRVITHRKPVYSALYFVLLILSVTGLMVLADAEFLAAALVIVYAGAILVTYVFVIMLAQQARPALYDTRAREPFWGCLAGFVLLAVITSRLFAAPEAPPTQVTEALGPSGTVQQLGTRLLTHYIVAIQLAGLLLLAAMVGAIAIARRRTTVDTLSTGEVD